METFESMGSSGSPLKSSEEPQFAPSSLHKPGRSDSIYERRSRDHALSGSGVGGSNRSIPKLSGLNPTSLTEVKPELSPTHSKQATFRGWWASPSASAEGYSDANYSSSSFSNPLTHNNTLFPVEHSSSSAGVVSNRPPPLHPPSSSLPISPMSHTTKVISYNILAERYSGTKKYPHCPIEALQESYRAANIINEIAMIKPDIICFQELSSGMHDGELFGQQLRDTKTFGYDSFHVPITDKSGNCFALPCSGSGLSASNSVTNSLEGKENPNATTLNKKNSGSNNIWAGTGATMSKATSQPAEQQQQKGDGFSLSVGRPRPECEGVGIFFKTERYQLIEAHPVKFNSLTHDDVALGKLTESEARRVSIGSHNVGLISIFDDKQCPGDVLIVCNIHAYWDFSQQECQLYQIIKLLSTAENLYNNFFELSESRVNVVLCGDLNAEPDSASLHYIRNGFVNRSLPCFSNFFNAKHHLPLRWSYHEYFEKNCDKVTCVGSSFCGIIDYIFGDKDLIPVSVYETEAYREIPDACTPSDHFPIGTVFVPRNVPADETLEE